MGYIRRRRQFEETLRDTLAKLEREGVDRMERSQVEEIGEQFELDRDEARKLFVKSRGDIWKGEFIESDEDPGWEAVELESIPSAESSPEDSSV